MKSGVINAQIEISEDILHDLAEGQRHDCQIVAPETKHRDADEKADGAGHHAAHHHGNHQPYNAVGNRRGQQSGHNHTGERADAHKSRMTQTQFTADTYQQVQGNCQHNIGAGRHQKSLHGAAQLALTHEQLEDQERRRYQNVGGRTHDFVLCQSFFHNIHLIPSPEPACPADLQASPAGSQSGRQTRSRR